jgi:hypothetical protein
MALLDSILSDSPNVSGLVDELTARLIYEQYLNIN